MKHLTPARELLDIDHDGEVTLPELAIAAVVGFGALGLGFMVGALVFAVCG